MKTITLAFTGASGLPYGMRLLECLLQSGQRVHLIYFASRADRRQTGTGFHAAEPSAGRGADCSRIASANSAAS